MQPDNEPSELFNRYRRHAFRERAGRRGGDGFLWRLIADEFADRLTAVSRDFRDVLFVGPMADYASQILANRQVAITDGRFVEEDRLPFDAASFDLVICGGTLDSVNDLPGALVQIRRCLRPDGLFLGHMFGAGSLASLKAALLQAETDRAAPHIHPQIDLRTAADLLSRAGFALPVADTDATVVRYGDWRTLVGDIRDMGLGNALAGPRAFLGRDIAPRLDTAWQARASIDGKVEERFVHIHLSGWSPSANQPKPAERGSGTISLTSILSPSNRPD